MIDIGNDITNPAGDITGRKDITRSLVISGVDDITKNRPVISLASDITGDPPTISPGSDITGEPPMISPAGDNAGEPPTVSPERDITGQVVISLIGDITGQLGDN